MNWSTCPPVVGSNSVLSECPVWSFSHLDVWSPRPRLARAALEKNYSFLWSSIYRSCRPRRCGTGGWKVDVPAAGVYWPSISTHSAAVFVWCRAQPPCFAPKLLMEVGDLYPYGLQEAGELRGGFELGYWLELLKCRRERVCQAPQRPRFEFRVTGLEVKIVDLPSQVLRRV